MALVWLYCSITAVPRLSYSCSVIAVVLPCCCGVFRVAVAVQAHFDLYMTSALVGHHVPFQPLVTGPHLHPSPASSPPSSSSPSTLPSSSQSSVTGPPRFSFSYPLFSHDFLLVREKALSVSASILFCRFYSADSASLCVLFAVSVSLFSYKLYIIS